jgi:PAS domain S-box-containing protein
VAQSAPTGFFVVGSEGVIIFANEQLGRQFGYARDELVGRPLAILLPDAEPPSPDVDKESFIKRLAESTLGRALVARCHDGGLLAVDISWTPTESQNGLVFVGSVATVSVLGEHQHATLEKELEFERFFAELTEKFIHQSAEQVLETAHKALERLGTILNVDRCAFFRLRDDDAPLASVLAWRRRDTLPRQPTFPSISVMQSRFPWAMETLLAGKVVRFSSVDEIPNAIDRASYRTEGIRAAVTEPLSVHGRTVGGLGFNMMDADGSWTPDTLRRIRAVAALFSALLARSLRDEALQAAMARAEHSRDRVRDPNAYLSREISDPSDALLSRSRAFNKVVDQLRQVATTDSPVLLRGETGVGKEVLATHLHALSARGSRMMVRVSCSAIPSSLIESELFGREKAFAGALARQIGRFELASHSTIFFDEIGDLPAEVQVKFLRVLEERTIERLGGPTAIPVDVRIIAATHRNLEKRVAEGTFREDLFNRLNVFPIQVPPLRERVEDIPALVWKFVQDFSQAFGKRIEAIPRDNMAALQQYAWPGNIRELRSIVERAMIVASGEVLTLAVPVPSAPARKRSAKLEDVEREPIRAVLELTARRIRGAG